MRKTLYCHACEARCLACRVGDPRGLPTRGRVCRQTLRIAQCAGGAMVAAGSAFGSSGGVSQFWVTFFICL